MPDPLSPERLAELRRWSDSAPSYGWKYVWASTAIHDLLDHIDYLQTELDRPRAEEIW